MQRKQVKDRPIDQRYTDMELVDFNPARMPDTEPPPLEQATQVVAKGRPTRQGFTMLPDPWRVRLRAARRAATWNVAAELLSRSFKEHQQTIRLSNVGLASIGVASRQKWRALAELEKLGLVSIDRRTRKSPYVTLLYPKEGDKRDRIWDRNDAAEFWPSRDRNDYTVPLLSLLSCYFSQIYKRRGGGDLVEWT